MFPFFLSKIKQGAYSHFLYFSQAIYSVLGYLCILSLIASCSQQNFIPPRLPLPDNWGLNIVINKTDPTSKQNNRFDSNDLW